MSEFTPAQHRAVAWVKDSLTQPMSISASNHLSELLRALPQELVNPRPELPSNWGATLRGVSDGKPIRAMRGGSSWAVLFTEMGQFAWLSEEDLRRDLGEHTFWEDTIPKPETLPVATQDEVERHAQKQGASWSDAWSYYEDLGYDMSQVAEQYS